MAIKATLEEIEECLREHEIEVLNRSSVEHGVKLTLSNKAILVAYNNCTCLVQGKPESAQIVKSFLSQIKSNGKNRLVKNIFIVYGHADTDRKVLENMIRKFGLNPLVLSDLPSKGSTLIEKLEEYSGTADYGVVLATPDDFGIELDRMLYWNWECCWQDSVERGLQSYTKSMEKMQRFLSKSPLTSMGLFTLSIKQRQTKLV